MDEIGLERSLKVSLLFGLVGIAMFAVGMALDIEKFVVVGALVFAVGLVFLADRRTKPAVSEDGVRYAGWGTAHVPWEEFIGLRVIGSRFATFLQLVPRDPDLLLRRFSAVGRFNDWVQRSFGQPRFGIPISTLAGPVDEAMARIRARLKEMPGGA